MKRLIFLALTVLLFATEAHAVTRFIKTSCTNGITTYNPATDTCTGGLSPVYNSINNGLAALVAGDVLYIRAGTYNERLLIYNIAGMQAGTSFTNAITISSYPGETVTIKPTAAGGPAIQYSDGAPKDWYHIWQNLTVDGTATGAGGIITSVNANTRRVRFQDMIVQNGGGGTTSGQGFSWYGDFNEFLRIESHHNGTFNDHLYNEACGYGYYIGGSNNLIEGGSIHHNGGYGIHGYHFGGGGGGNNIVRGVQVYDNGACAGQETSAILMWTDGGNNQIYGNTVYMTGSSNPAGVKGISIAGAASVAYNNTVYNFNYPGLSIVNAPGSTLRNNIVYQTDTSGAFGTQIEQYPSSAGNTVSNNILTNPSFVNSGASDFHLQAGSPAINAGVATIASGITIPVCAGSVTTYCYNGTAPDAGAYETAPIVVPPVNQLVLALPLDEGSGTTAVDVSGQKNNASLVGGATWDNTGIYGKAIALDGTGYLNIPASASLALAPEMTLEAWIYPTAPFTGFSTVIRQDRYFLYAASDVGYCPAVALAGIGGYATSENKYVCATAAPPPTTWSHLAITYSASTLTFYLNGNVIASQVSTDPMVPTTANVTIGASQFGENFIGKIDQPMIYTYARTRPQILSDMGTALIGAPGKYVEIAAPLSVEISAARSLEISAD